MRLSALTYDYDGYSKFELGGRFSLNRKITDQYEVGLVYAARHVEVTDATIDPLLLGEHLLFRQLDRVYPNARPAQKSARRAARFCFR